jgi:hypothetical protein
MKPVFIAVLSVILLATGCTSSRITHSWKSETAGAKQYNKIMVVGLIHDNDRLLREEMENQVAIHLKELGYNCVSSLRELGPKSFAGMKEEEAISKLRNDGVDAVITIVLLDKSKERYYVPGRVYYTPYTIYYRRWWGYYSTIYSRIYEPGYYREDTRYFWESNFYDMGNRELLYSVQTESFDPASTASLAHEYGQLIVNDMVKNKVLTGQKSAAAFRPM